MLLICKFTVLQAYRCVSVGRKSCWVVIFMIFCVNVLVEPGTVNKNFFFFVLSDSHDWQRETVSLLVLKKRDDAEEKDMKGWRWQRPAQLLVVTSQCIHSSGCLQAWPLYQFCLQLKYERFWTNTYTRHTVKSVHANSHRYLGFINKILKQNFHVHMHIPTETHTHRSFYKSVCLFCDMIVFKKTKVNIYI